MTNSATKSAMSPAPLVESEARSQTMAKDRFAVVVNYAETGPSTSSCRRYQGCGGQASAVQADWQMPKTWRGFSKSR